MIRESDGVLCCTIDHTVVTCDLVAMESIDMPDDVRSQVQDHLVADAAGVGGEARS